jgi:hypothetical protein
MSYIIEVSEHKKEKLSEHIENALHEMGRAMQCVETLGEHEYGQRGGSYGSRYDDEEMRMGMRGRMGYREMDDDDEDFGERRGRRRRDSRGRYM